MFGEYELVLRKSYCIGLTTNSLADTFCKEGGGEGFSKSNCMRMCVIVCSILYTSIMCIEKQNPKKAYPITLKLERFHHGKIHVLHLIPLTKQIPPTLKPPPHHTLSALSQELWFNTDFKLCIIKRIVHIFEEYEAPHHPLHPFIFTFDNGLLFGVGFPHTHTHTHSRRVSLRGRGTHNVYGVITKTKYD